MCGVWYMWCVCGVRVCGKCGVCSVYMCIWCWGREASLGEVDVLPETRPQTPSSLEVPPCVCPGWIVAPGVLRPPLPIPARGRPQKYSVSVRLGRLHWGRPFPDKEESRQQARRAQSRLGLPPSLGLVCSRAVCCSASPGVAGAQGSARQQSCLPGARVPTRPTRLTRPTRPSSGACTCGETQAHKVAFCEVLLNLQQAGWGGAQGTTWGEREQEVAGGDFLRKHLGRGVEVREPR